jgi:hypothetical protein
LRRCVECKMLLEPRVACRASWKKSTVYVSDWS